MQEIHEECGVLGVWSPEKREIGKIVYNGLFALQHRGQESAGIAVNEDRIIRCDKDLGLVHEVFTSDRLTKLGEGQIGVGHVRYSTSGSMSALNAQPMLVRHIKGQLALCHNGNLTNSFELRRWLELEGCIFQTTSDTEVISYLITRMRISSDSIEKAVQKTMQILQGAYSLVMTSPAKLIACRDPYGIRPLCYGITGDGCHVLASETCALDAVGAVWIRDLEPGEILVIDHDGVRSLKMESGNGKRALCVFELIYFARSDSCIEGACVHESRKRAGMFLAQEHPVDADVVIGVPDSGLDAAFGYSQYSKIPFGMGLVRNKYIGRSFISPTQEQRENQVRQKLNPIRSVVEGKRVILLDDSMVRGTTCSYIVRMLKEAKAREVHVRISSPPFKNPCYYGTDIDSRQQLIANDHTIEQMRESIGADSLGFLSVEHARRLVEGRNPDTFCAACFDGRYPVKAPVNADKMRFEY